MKTGDYELDTTRRDAPLRISARGRAVLVDPMMNRGTAFTKKQRRALGLIGLLPIGVSPISDQVRRVYEQYRSARTPFAKHKFLANLRDRNEVLFYRLLADHIEEMLPIIYTPTIGEVIERFSLEFNRARGVFLSIDRPDDIEPALRGYDLGPDDVDLIVVTDSEGILGIGDQGIGGIEIAIGKLSLYTAAAGLHPRRVIPVVLDVGTDNLGLLNSDLYLGERHARVRGERYDEFVDTFVRTVARLFPHAMLHWEDFGANTAHRILERYRHEICTFNDDIQGTAAVALAAVLAGVERHGRAAYVITASSSTAVVRRDRHRRPPARHPHPRGPDRRGRDAEVLRPGQPRALRRRPAVAAGLPEAVCPIPGRGRRWEVAGGTARGIGLADVVRNVRPTILIGTSTIAGAFSEEIVTEMARHVERPIIMPLSNPTSHAEALPADLLAWTDGRALIATGSPFAPVDHNEVRHVIAQANNALIFPGLGLGVAAAQATRITDGMIMAAAETLAGQVNAYRPGASLLPGMSELRPVSAHVALAVARAAAAEGVAERPLSDPINDIYQRMWQPEYPEIEVV